MDFDFLRVKYRLDQFRHTTTLWDHLKGVHDLLKSWGEEEEVCRAGLFHSVYGTQFYQEDAVDLGEREELARHIGERAEKLVYYFCASDRASLWKNATLVDPSQYRVWDRIAQRDLSLTPVEMQDYFSIFVANLIDQRPYLKTGRNVFVSELLASRRLMKPHVWNNFLKEYGLK